MCKLYEQKLLCSRILSKVTLSKGEKNVSSFFLNMTFSKVFQALQLQSRSKTIQFFYYKLSRLNIKSCILLVFLNYMSIIFQFDCFGFTLDYLKYTECRKLQVNLHKILTCVFTISFFSYTHFAIHKCCFARYDFRHNIELLV